ncbi:MAG: hypothetical protein HYV27_11630 [Candidatus Hydrogenedentes bacterium]|nr:hypothetical protein [Candidatus Hydrogenedentota bacterium]
MNPMPQEANTAGSLLTPMDLLLEALCDHFDDELERQQTILEVCRAQGHAARAHNRAALEDRAVALALLIQEATLAEKRRLELLRQLVDALNLPLERQTLSGLIAAIDHPWKLRMQEFQLQMRGTLAATKEIVRENNLVLRRSLRIVNQALSRVAPAWAGEQHYTHSGAANARTGVALPGRINQQG